MAGLEYYTEPALEVTPTSSTLMLRSHFGSSCFGSNPRGQVVVACRASHHASVVPGDFATTP